MTKEQKQKLLRKLADRKLDLLKTKVALNMSKLELKAMKMEYAAICASIKNISEELYGKIIVTD